MARQAFKAGDFHRLLVLFKQELAALSTGAEKKLEAQALTDVLSMNLPSKDRRPSKHDMRVASTQKARARAKSFGGALSGCFLYRT